MFMMRNAVVACVHSAKKCWAMSTRKFVSVGDSQFLIPSMNFLNSWMESKFSWSLLCRIVTHICIIKSCVLSFKNWLTAFIKHMAGQLVAVNLIIDKQWLQPVYECKQTNTLAQLWIGGSNCTFLTYVLSYGQ